VIKHEFYGVTTAKKLSKHNEIFLDIHFISGTNEEMGVTF
jgi:hypothetical protein